MCRQRLKDNRRVAVAIPRPERMIEPLLAAKPGQRAFSWRIVMFSEVDHYHSAKQILLASSTLAIPERLPPKKMPPVHKEILVVEA